MGPIKPPIPPKPAHLLNIGQSSSSRRGSFEIKKVKPSKEQPTLQLTLPSGSKDSSSLLAAFEAKTTDYHDETNNQKKALLYQELVAMATKAKKDKDVSVDVRRKFTKTMYETSKTEVARLRNALDDRAKMLLPLSSNAQSATLSATSLDDKTQSVENSALGTQNTFSSASAIEQTPSFADPPTQNLESVTAKRAPMLKLSAAELQQRLQSIQANSLSIKQLELKDTDGKIHTHFYCNDAFIGELTPNDKNFERGFGSAMKYLATKNDSTAVIKHRNRFKFTTAESQVLADRKNNLFSALSSQLSATCLNYFVDTKGSIVTQNGGVDLHSFLNDNNDTVINCASFKDAAKDLEILHQHGFHHLDLKPENFTFDGQKIRIIDTDGMPLMPTSTQISIPSELKIFNSDKRATFPEFTADYFPAPLQTEIGGIYNRSTNLMHLGKMRKAADTFSFLMTMIEATEGNFFSNEVDEATNREKPRGAGLREKAVFFLNDKNEAEIETESELAYAQKWSQTYVKPEYREHFSAFLQSPRAYASHRHNPELIIHDIIDWSAKPPEEDA